MSLHSTLTMEATAARPPAPLADFRITSFRVTPAGVSKDGYNSDLKNDLTSSSTTTTMKTERASVKEILSANEMTKGQGSYDNDGSECVDSWKTAVTDCLRDGPVIGHLNDEPGRQMKKDASYYIHGGSLFDILGDLDYDSDEEECPSKSDATSAMDDDSLDFADAVDGENSDSGDDCVHMHLRSLRC